jgi:hypothetical protein
MNRAVFTTIAATGFGVAFFHAAIPTHWLPFVLASRAQKWGRAKTLLVTALAGAGHVLFTTLLGVLVVWLGIGLSRQVGAMFPLVAGGALILFGFFYLIRQFSGGGHGHLHLFGKGHSHAHASHSHHSIGTGHDHGAHGGTMVNLGHGFVEVSIFEREVPPRFRLYFSNATKILLSSLPNAGVTIETVRTDGHQEEFHFERRENYLESTSNIPEPHEFHAILKIAHGDHVHEHEIEFVEHDHGSEHAHGHESDAFAKHLPIGLPIGSLFALLTFSPAKVFCRFI